MPENSEYKSEYDSFSRFWLNFQATIKYAFVSVRFILLKVGVHGFTGPWRESNVR